MSQHEYHAQNILKLLEAYSYGNDKSRVFRPYSVISAACREIYAILLIFVFFLVTLGVIRNIVDFLLLIMFCRATRYIWPYRLLHKRLVLRHLFLTD